MSSDLILANIKNYLDEKGHLPLPGIGSLNLIWQKASINSSTKTMVSPGEKIVLLESNSFPTDDLFHYIGTHTDLNFEEIKELYFESMIRLKRELQIFGRTELEGLGDIIKSDMETLFIPAKKNSNHLLCELPAIYIEELPIVLDEIVEEIPIHSETEVPLEKKQNNSITEGIQEDKRTEIPAISIVKEPKGKKVKSLRRIADPILDLVGAALVFFILLFVFHKGDINLPDFAIFEKIERIEIEPGRLNMDPEILLINENTGGESISSNLNKNPQPKCALILGSFTKESNAIEMQKMLIGLGYNLFTEVYEEFLRVGVNVNCKDVNGNIFDHLKSETGVDAWLRVH